MRTLTRAQAAELESIHREENSGNLTTIVPDAEQLTALHALHRRGLIKLESVKDTRLHVFRTTTRGRIALMCFEVMKRMGATPWAA